MPDPHVLYAVTAVVVLGLVAWVVVVLSRPAEPRLGPKIETKPRPAGDSPKETVRSAPVMPPARPFLPSHQEIQDEPSVTVDVEEEEDPTGPHALILVTAVGRTDPGLKRTHNEDAYAILEDHHLFVIADGMGRHAAGEVASQLCVDAIREAFTSGDLGGKEGNGPKEPKRARRLRASIALANDRIVASARDNDEYAGMGTTVVAAYFSQSHQRVYVAHVGDSRCYRLRGGKLTQLTTDHTLGAAGIVGKSSTVLSRAVGVEDNVEIDLTMESPLPGDIYLLCSDGLSRMVSADDIKATLEATPDLDGATRVLIDKANQCGGRDNITAILVRVKDARASLGMQVAR